MQYVMKMSIFLVTPLVHIGGYNAAADNGSSARAMGDPAVQNLLEQFKKIYGLSPLKVFSVDYRMYMVGNVLAVGSQGQGQGSSGRR